MIDRPITFRRPATITFDRLIAIARRRHLRHRAERYTNVQVARAACTECGRAHGGSARGAGPAGLRCRAHTYSRHARVRTKGFFVRARFRGSAEFSLGVFGARCEVQGAKCKN